MYVRMDNAKELYKEPRARLHNSFGIKHKHSCTETHQQDVVMERKRKHLIETAKALFLQSNLSNAFWGACVLCATYLVN